MLELQAPNPPSCSKNSALLVPFDQKFIAFESSFIESGFIRRKLPTNSTLSIFSFIAQSIAIDAMLFVMVIRVACARSSGVAFSRFSLLTI